MNEERDNSEEEEGLPSEEAGFPPAEPGPGSPPEPESGPPTEELFAFEARVEEGEVPDLDPVFRAALLESSESMVPVEPASPPDGEAGGGAHAAGLPQVAA